MINSQFSDEKQGSIDEQAGINEEFAEPYGHPIIARFSDAECRVRSRIAPG